MSDERRRLQLQGWSADILWKSRNPMEPVRMCGRCGGVMSAEGALYSAVRLTFRPQDAKFMTLETGDVMTKAIMCRDCGLIEIVGDANKLRRLTSTRGQPPPEPEQEAE